MSRNIKKETEWRKTKYKRFVVDVDKEIAEQFQEKLKNENITYSDWVKLHIKKFLENL